MPQHDDFFQRVSEHMGDPNRRKYELNWFRKQIRAASTPQERKRPSVRDLGDRHKRKLRIGQMYFMTYDALHKADLPYYDRFPLFLPFNQVPRGFMGINVHYLPPALRFELFHELRSLVRGGTFDEDARFQRLSWQTLTRAARSRYIEPAVKRYRGDRVRSPFVEIHGDEWHIAAAIDIANFRGANKTTVWAESVG